MAVINTLAADILALRGYDAEYHRLSRFFRTRTEAENALTDGTWEPVDGVLNVCITGDEGLLLYDANDTVNGMLTVADSATRTYIDEQIATLVGDSPDTLNTITELAAALNNNPNFFADLNSRIENIEEGADFTGAITAPVAASVIPFYHDSVASFPDATSVHGAVAHAHHEGGLYYAHGGSWVKLATETEAVYISNLTNAMGIPTGDGTMGSFTGNTIADGSSVKEALQSLETAQEASTVTLPTMIHASWDASSGGSFDFATNGIASSGVSTVTRQAQGIYRVEFTTPFATNAYTVTCGVGSTDYSGTNASPREVSILTRTTDYVEVICERSDDAVNEDNFYMSVIIMG